jgi:hypothetical protein
MDGIERNTACNSIHTKEGSAVQLACPAGEAFPINKQDGERIRKSKFSCR